jgi:hypothetical protein
MMRRAVISALSFFLFALSLPAQNFPERPASALALFHNDEREVAAASDGTDFLVIGFRLGALAHRVTAAGEVLDVAGIRIPFADDALRNIKILGVFWAGDAYTIVSQSLITTGGIQSPSTPPDYRTYVTRIDRDGRIIDGPRVVYASRFVLWSAVSNGSRIVLLGERLAILDVRGNLLESNLPIPSDFYNNFDFRAAWNGKGFMVTWSANRPFGEQVLRVAPLDADGRPTGASTSIPTGLAIQPAIASDGTDYVVVYKEATSGTDYALHIGAGGELLERRPLPGSLQSQRSIVWNGTNYIVALVAGDAKQLPSVFRLDKTGALVDPAPVAISSVGAPGLDSAIVTATDGRRIFLVWQETSPVGSYRSFGATLGSDMKLGPPSPLGLTPGVQQSPQVAIGHDNFMVVWEEGSVVYASRLTFAGELLDGRGIKLSTKIGKMPRVVFDGQTYVVAWWSQSTWVVAAHVSPDGTILKADETPILASCSGDFGLATDGATALVVASDCQSYRVSAVRLHRDGVADSPIFVSPQSMTDAPTVSWNGERYLVAWRQLISLPSNHYPNYRGNILAARLSSSLAVLDTAPIPIAVSDTENAVAPLVASNGTDFLVAWTTGTPRARVVKRDGAVGEPIAGVAQGLGTSLAWDGRRYALAFTDAKDVFVTRVGEGSPAAIAASADVESNGALAALGNGVLIAAYVRQATEQLYGGVPRVFVKGIVPQSRTRAIR